MSKVRPLLPAPPLMHDWGQALAPRCIRTARLLYHKPKYAIVDECGSAVAMLREGKM